MRALRRYCYVAIMVTRPLVYYLKANLFVYRLTSIYLHGSSLELPNFLRDRII
jgi:hypothetical protein